MAKGHPNTYDTAARTTTIAFKVTRDMKKHLKVKARSARVSLSQLVYEVLLDWQLGDF